MHLKNSSSSLRTLFPDLPKMVVADIGASDLDGDPPYARWRNDADFSLIGFEPSPEEFARLTKNKESRATYYPHALGDGTSGELKVCHAPGMTSLLEPDQSILRHFHGFVDWGAVERRLPIQTSRLDDLPEVPAADFIKIDVQGSELDILRNGLKVVRSAVCIQVEVNFVPFYVGQPLFAEIDQFMRSEGFFFHCFTPLISRSFIPFLVDNDFYKGISQQLWADAVYFRQFSELSRLTPRQLLKVALTAHDLYGAVDFAHLALSEFDKQSGETRASRYLQFLGLMQ